MKPSTGFLLLPLAAAFVPFPTTYISMQKIWQSQPRPTCPPFVVAKASSADIFDSIGTVQVTGNNVEVTASMREYVLKKIGHVLEKFHKETQVVKCDIHLSIVEEAHNAKHSHTAEATIRMKGGQKSVLLCDSYKGRNLSKRRQKDKLVDTAVPDYSADAEAYESLPEELDTEYLSPDDPTNSVDMKLVKTKEFDMPPMNIKDAIVCLSYIGHPFFVYRDDQSQEIQVVYKRRTGGVGVIKPRN